MRGEVRRRRIVFLTDEDAGDGEEVPKAGGDGAGVEQICSDDLMIGSLGLFARDGPVCGGSVVP